MSEPSIILIYSIDTFLNIFQTLLSDNIFVIVVKCQKAVFLVSGWIDGMLLIFTTLKRGNFYLWLTFWVLYHDDDKSNIYCEGKNESWFHPEMTKGSRKYQRKRLTLKESSLTNPCKNPAANIDTAKGCVISYNKSKVSYFEKWRGNKLYPLHYGWGLLNVTKNISFHKIIRLGKTLEINDLICGYSYWRMIYILRNGDNLTLLQQFLTLSNQTLAK